MGGSGGWRAVGNGGSGGREPGSQVGQEARAGLARRPSAPVRVHVRAHDEEGGSNKRVLQSIGRAVG